MRQENSLRRSALILEPWTSCDLVGVLGPCQLSRNGVLSLQARLGQRPFSGWRWGCPLREGGLGGMGWGPLGGPSVEGSDFLRLTGK